MSSDRVYELLISMIDCDELSFSFKIKTISNLLTDAETVGSLGSKYIELIDRMLKKCSNNSEKKALWEIKLLALDELYYSDEYLKNNGIDLRKYFQEYMDIARGEEVSAEETAVLGSYYIDSSYAQDIEEHLLKFLSDSDKIKLMLGLDRQQMKNIIGCKSNDNIVRKVGYYQRARERFDIVIKTVIVTHPQKSDEFFYLLFPNGYSYENVKSDWYWKSQNEYDRYAANGIISKSESDILCKIGDMIDNDSCTDNAECNNALCKLFYEFVHGRPLDELLFPKFLGCEI